ncbi:hypothetical protein ACFFX0_20015 [Citricoccus parietis]|uniref:Uncharacterized protein n=1 Tax=Citricoccus parietis TaxID=592307 RepID=A0ABV5G354_9MICC
MARLGARPRRSRHGPREPGSARGRPPGGIGGRGRRGCRRSSGRGGGRRTPA